MAHLGATRAERFANRVGLLYLEHGTQKIFNFPPRPQAPSFELFTLAPGLAGILELVGGILIVLGLFTRPVAFVLSGEMAVAYSCRTHRGDFFR